MPFPIAFDEARWERTEREWTLFWQGEQERPMVLIQGFAPDRPPIPGWHRYFPQYAASLPLIST